MMTAMTEVYADEQFVMLDVGIPISPSITDTPTLITS